MSITETGDVVYPHPLIKKSIIIATPFYEIKAYSPYVSSLVDTVRILTLVGVRNSYWRLDGCSYVTHGKNYIATKFLQSDFTDLLIIDSDIEFNPQTVCELLMFDELVVSVPYKQRGKNDYGVVFVSDNDKGKPLREAQWVSGGFLRIRKEALERYIEKYTDSNYIYNGEKFYNFFDCATNKQWISEDAVFSLKMRNIGIPVYYYTNAKLSHYASISCMTGNYYLEREKNDIT